MLHLYVLALGASEQDWGNPTTCRVPSSSGALRHSPGASLKISALHLNVTRRSFSC